MPDNTLLESYFDFSNSDESLPEEINLKKWLGISIIEESNSND